MQRPIAPPALLGLALLLGSIPTSVRADDRDEAETAFLTYCYRCHGNGSSQGNLALDDLLDAPIDGKSRLAWEKVRALVRDEFMPPAHAKRMGDDERKAITRWVERDVFGVDPARPDPGRVTIRRLNRMEYHHTVRDLFGIDLDLARELPPDDTAFGFDNIGDAQTVSPNLLETYLNLAETIAGQVVVTDGPRHPRINLTAANFRPQGPPDADGRASQATDATLRHDGRHRAEVMFRLGGFRSTTGDYRVRVTFGGQAIAEQVVNDGGEKTYTLGGEVDLPAGVHPLVVTTEPVDADGQPETGVEKPRSLTPPLRGSVVGPIGTGIYEDPEPHRRLFARGPAPDDTAGRRAYAREILGRLADRAFRRPAGAATHDRLADLALRADTFEAGIARGVTAILSSPRFYYRAELQPNPDDPAEVVTLDDFALASRLSYLLWLSLPDDELSALAAQGRLRDEVGPQVRRLLADPKSERFFEDFAGQWLRTRNVLLTPLSGRGSGVVDPVRGSLKRETEMFFEHVAREGRDLIELLTADYSFLNESLARFYGIADVRGNEMRKVELPAESHRGGLLTHGSLLISTSNPNRTSPVKRGVFVLENLLGKEVPPPPPNVTNLEDARGEDGARPRTLREQLALHRDQPACASCHAQFDPIGLALENFDNLGRWRDRDGREPVDATSTLSTGEAIDGIAGLRVALASRPDRFYRCTAEKFLTYALGRGLEPGDTPAVDGIVDRMKAEGGTFDALLMGVVDSVPFRSRRGDAGDSALAGRGSRPEPPPLERRGAAGRAHAAALREQQERREDKPTATPPQDSEPSPLRKGVEP